MFPWIIIVFVVQLLPILSGQDLTTASDTQTTATWNTSEFPSNLIEASPVPGCGLDHCATCTQPAALCTGCEDGHFLTGTNQCSVCPTNCTECTSQICLKCQDGLYVSEDGKSCQKCGTPGCRRCHSNQTCTNCHDGFYVEGNQCKECLEECSVCHKEGSTLKCDSCSEGHLLVAQSVCVKACPLDCKSCKVNIISRTITCTECQPGFYITEEGGCSDCSDDCVECHVNGSRLQCDKCVIGMYVDRNHNCSACDLDYPCTTCTRGPPVCLTCSDSYRLRDDPGQGCQYDPSNDCYSCFSGCPSNVTEDLVNVTTRYCQGLNATSSCIASRSDLLTPTNTSDSNNTSSNTSNTSSNTSNSPPSVSYSYGCEQEVCSTPPGVQVCLYHTDTTTLVCSRCCVSRECNREGPPGISLDSPTELDDLVKLLTTDTPTSGAETGGVRWPLLTCYLTFIYGLTYWYAI